MSVDKHERYYHIGNRTRIQLLKKMVRNIDKWMTDLRAKYPDKELRIVDVPELGYDVKRQQAVATCKVEFYDSDISEVECGVSCGCKGECELHEKHRN